MDQPQFTQLSSQTLQQALDLAKQNNNPLAEDWHLLLALTNIDGISRQLIQQLTTNTFDTFHQQLVNKVEQLPKTNSTPQSIQPSSLLQQLLQQTISLSRQFNDEYISQE